MCQACHFDNDSNPVTDCDCSTGKTLDDGSTTCGCDKEAGGPQYQVCVVCQHGIYDMLGESSGVGGTASPSSAPA